MYLEYFRLRERPFSSTPDPRFVYLGAQHERALAHLLGGVRDRSGVVQLTGERGNGKTTVCRVLLHRLPAGVDVALILNPVGTPAELLAAVCDEIGVTYASDAPSPTLLGHALSRHLEAHAGGRRTVLIVDEAQSLGLDVLEELRRLSTLEIAEQKLLQIILIGEPSLTEPLGRLSQPVVAGYHLLPLAENETCAYVRHRLTVAGGAHDIFDVEALREVHHLSNGVPRLINAICDRALLSAAVQRRRGVDRLTVRAAARAALAPAGSVALEPVEVAPRVERATIARKPTRAPARARRPLYPWLVSGGLALNAAVIGAVFLVPRPADVVAPPLATVANVEAPPRVETPTIPTTPTDDSPRVAREPAPPVPSAKPAAPPPPTRPITPPSARPTAPARSYAPEPYPPSSDRAWWRRRERIARGVSPTSPLIAPEGEEPSREPRPLKVDLLVWAVDPRERMVYLNGRKYVEGQRLESGAVVEQIAEDGVVLVQGGRRVRLPSEARIPYFSP